jgi:O-antigen/teichoic acid export membrane protein
MANAGSRVFSFLFVFYASRALHPGPLGVYTTVTGFVALFGVVTDLGLGTFAVRDVSTNRGLAVRYISNLLAVRLLLSFLCLALIVVLAQVLYPAYMRGSAYVFALTLVPQAVSNTLQLAFQFSERLSYSAALNIVGTATTSLLGIVVLALSHSVLALVTVSTVVAIVTAVATAWIVYARFLPRRLELDPCWWPALLAGAIPFVVLTFANVLYNQADRQILFVLSNCAHHPPAVGCAPTGKYGVAYRPLDILVSIFVGSANAAVLPTFMRVGRESRQNLVRLVRLSGTLAFVFGVPIALLTTFFATEALHVVGGKLYLDAAPALGILIWTFPCVLLLTMLYNALYAVHKQTVVTVSFIITFVFNVVLNIVLIPHFSYFASAAVTVASEVVNGVIVLYVLRRALGPIGLVAPALRVGVVILLATLVLWILHPYGIFIGLPIGVVVILVGLRVSRVVGPEEQEILGRMPLFGRYARLLS